MLPQRRELARIKGNESTPRRTWKIPEAEVTPECVVRAGASPLHASSLPGLLGARTRRLAAGIPYGFRAPGPM